MEKTMITESNTDRLSTTVSGRLHKFVSPVVNWCKESNIFPPCKSCNFSGQQDCSLLDHFKIVDNIISDIDDYWNGDGKKCNKECIYYEVNTTEYVAEGGVPDQCKILEEGCYENDGQFCPGIQERMKG